MAENGAGSGGGGAGGGDGMAAAAGAGKPPRPTIMLPPRSSMASLFHEGGGGASEVSPGPLTLVSSFFADDPETECRSFTQLLVGAMNSPVAAARRPAGISWEQEKVAAGGSEDGGAEGGGIGGDGGVSRLNRVKQNRPASLTVSQPQAFTIAPGLSPSSLLDSPGFFSSGLGTFVMSHQEALAQVTAQASQSQFKMLSQAEYPSEFVTTPPSSQQLIQETPTRKRNNSVFESAEGSLSDQISHPTAIVVDKPASDGYNWRKYGQKMVRSSEYPRSYYKCSHPNCPVKKKVEHSADGQITEIIYKGQHNHQRPTPNKRFKEGDSFLSGSNEITESLDNPSTPESGFHGNHGNLRRSNGMTAATSASKRDREFDYGAPEQLSGSTDREEVSETQTDGRDNHDADAKRMNVSASSQTTSAEPKIVVQTTSEVDLLDDGYRWRKYGQKVVKGNPNPRSYYKCTYLGCNVRKHVERAPTDPKSVITTYEGKHNHDVPTSRNSSRNLACAGVASSIVQSNSQPSLRTTNFRNNDQQPVAVLQLKEEREIT